MIQFLNMDKTPLDIKYIIGIDEVGRGPIAGPVAVCSFCAKPGDMKDLIEKAEKELGLPIRDSKKLTKKMRERWFEFLNEKKKEGKCEYIVSFVSSENIDKFGISKCIKKALFESLNNVTSSEVLFARSSDEEGRGARPSQKELLTSFSIYLDGGLHAPSEYINQETIIKGDEIHPVISLASIIAKVSRDKVMYDYAKKFPEYGFDKHVGYGTKAHYESIKKHGQTPIHRKSFIH